jgi:hypothetical protein
MNPRARQTNLIVEELDDQVIVYDRAHHLAHSLNRTAALVWRACDGQTTLAGIAACLRETLGDAADEDLVRLSLEKLEAARLLEPSSLAADPGLSRRRFMQTSAAGGALALLLPVIHSVVAPTPADAASQPPP